MRNLDQIIDSLPPERRARVIERGRQLIAEEMALRQLRQAHRLTQQNMAKILGVGQDRISKREHRSDMLLSTLRSYVEAMGGSLRLVVEFPDGSRAVLSSLGEAGEGDDPGPSPQRGQVKPRSRRHLQVAHADD
jgi:transcriptional regulator with XRE-family HTH domain